MRRSTLLSFSNSILVASLLLGGSLRATDYAVSAATGDDNNPGTLAQPFKTISKALGAVANGDTIFVFPGRYGPTLGEQFPMILPTGVKLLGVNARSCIIDAEFDPTSANNVVNGTIMQVGADCELAHMSIVNAPRDPGNPGNHWWKIAIAVHDFGGPSNNAHIHHCILDEFSRGIFVGGPSGNHSFQNVTIDNCVLTRFYVEAINATVNGGTSTGNRIFNCSVIGHRNPASNKPFNRACISFGNNAQFDVRNCVIKDGDWAGIEASTPSAITSDYNCLHGSGASFRGVTKGANDIEADPQLAFLPTTTATADPHHSGPAGPLWDAGTNIVTTGGDMDHDSPRLSGASVDIGADEFTGTDAWFVGTPRLGSSLHVGMLGTPNDAVFFAISLVSIPPVKIPGILGNLELDLGSSSLILNFPTNSNGFARQALPIPNQPVLVGLEAFIQCVDIQSSSFSDLDRIGFVQ